MKKLLIVLALMLMCSGLFAKQHYEIKFINAGYYDDVGEKVEEYVNSLIEKGYRIINVQIIDYFNGKGSNNSSYARFSILYEDIDK